MSTKKWPRYDEIKSETLLAKRCVVVKRFTRSVCPCNSSPRYFAAFLLNSDTVFLFPFVRVHILCFPSSYLILSSTKNPIVPRSPPSPFFFLHQETFLLYFSPPSFRLRPRFRTFVSLYYTGNVLYEYTSKKTRFRCEFACLYGFSNCPKNPAWNTSTSSHVPFDRFEAPL